MLKRWPQLRQAVWDHRPLRQKLALGVWLSVVPISLAASLLALAQAHRVVEGRLRQQLLWDANEASSWVSSWDDEHFKALQFMAQFPAIRALEPVEAAEVLRNAHRLYPQYNFSLLNRQGGVVARSRTGPRSARELHLSQMKAFAGISSSEVLGSNNTGKPCVTSSVPVYAQIPAHQEPPIAVLSSCMALRELGQATGVNALVQSSSDTAPDIPLIDLFDGPSRGYAVLMVLDPGRVVFLGSSQYSEQERSLMLDPQQSLRSPWGPMVRIALADGTEQDFAHTRVNGTGYYLAINRSHPQRTVVVVIDQVTAFSNVNNLFGWIWLGNLVALAVSSLAIRRICGTLSRPVDQAGEALSRISRGDFGDPLPTNNSDVGRLFAYVNQASHQLQAFLAESNAHAITDAQLEEARRIQADFLIRDLPSSACVELAACCEPAYQIGADWYDALELDGTTVVVVADVCDKGIPSALYMSVFRSLLRLSLRKEWTAGGDPAAALRQALTTVNVYMAETHGCSGMFATAFVGAYDPRQQLLSYVVAGHEQPRLLQSDGLERLQLGGPALGLFANARFAPGQCRMQPGDLLFAFSDGLPDARSPAEEPFGQARITALLTELASRQATAAELVEAFRQAVRQHIDTAEQFDDLTLLALKARPAHGTAS